MTVENSEFVVRVPFALKSDVGSFDAHEAQEIRASRWSNWASFSGLTVVLHGHPANMVRWSLSLDGIAKVVVMAPYTVCEAVAKTILQVCKPDVVLSDEHVAVDRWPPSLIKHYPVEEGLLPENCGTIASPRIATEWVLATSGTTGTPKLVGHTVSSLTRTVSNSSRSALHIWGLLYDPARFAGAQVVLQSMANGCILVVPPAGAALGTKVNFLVEHGVTAISATPTLWRNIMMTPAATKLQLKQITLGGEIADPQIIAFLKRSFPSAHITHIYASTEAGVGFAVHDGRAGFPAEWLNQENCGRRLRVTEHGTLAVQMLGSPQKYIQATESFVSPDGWLDTGDMIIISGGRAMFQGRINGSINIGGNKVMPEEVERVISSHSSVVAVVVRARKSSVAGALVEAVVQLDPEVPKNDHPEISRQIKKMCRERLAIFKVPAFVKIVDRLPMSDTGKSIRVAS